MNLGGPWVDNHWNNVYLEVYYIFTFIFVCLKFSIIKTKRKKKQKKEKKIFPEFAISKSYSNQGQPGEKLSWQIIFLVASQFPFSWCHHPPPDCISTFSCFLKCLSCILYPQNFGICLWFFWSGNHLKKIFSRYDLIKGLKLRVFSFE